MSLRQLCQANTFTVERQSSAQNDAAGWTKTYNTTNRATLPKSFHGRNVPLSSRERTEYAMRNLQVSHRVYVEEMDPQVDERDRLINDQANARRQPNDPVRYLYVIGWRNPDELNRYWIIECFESTGPK